MKSKIRTRSRKSTPWDSLPLLTPSQEFIRDNYKQHYFARHKSLCDSDEAALLNHYRPENCPDCGSVHFHKDGTTANGLQRYRCNHCGKSFSIVTGTIFEDLELPLSEWIEYCLTYPDAYEDYPFDDEPGSPEAWTVMRHRLNNKSFALLYDREGLCLNLKCEPLRGDFLRGLYAGVTPAYHMNKTHWITVRPGEDVPDEVIRDLIDRSWRLAAPKRSKPGR